MIGIYMWLCVHYAINLSSILYMSYFVSHVHITSINCLIYLLYFHFIDSTYYYLIWHGTRTLQLYLYWQNTIRNWNMNTKEEGRVGFLQPCLYINKGNDDLWGTELKLLFIIKKAREKVRITWRFLAFRQLKTRSRHTHTHSYTHSSSLILFLSELLASL